MFKSIWEDTKREFSHGNMVTRLIIINVVFFICINLVWVILRLTHAWQTPELYFTIRNFFLISSDWLHIVTHPWSVITSMFAHDGFWHILFNMLFLYWFGRIVGDFLGDHRILPLYLLGGLAGGLAFFLSVNLLPYGGDSTHYALGASAAVMAIVVAAGFIAPDYYLRLLLLGDVKLKYIVFALVLIDIVGIGGDINTGGHFAHLGGAAMGWLFVWQLQHGNDWSETINNWIFSVRQFFQGIGKAVRQDKKPRVVYRNANPSGRNGNTREAPHQRGSGGLSHQEQLDAILDKIKDTGYESLTREEKEFLFNASKK